MYFICPVFCIQNIFLKIILELSYQAYAASFMHFHMWKTLALPLLGFLHYNTAHSYNILLMLREY